MSQENVELVRRVHESWAQGDFSAGVDLITPEFEYEQNPDAVEPGVRRGEGVGKALRGIFDVYRDFRVEPRDFRDAHDRVMVSGRARGTARGSRLDLDMEIFCVWEVRQGRLISNAV